MDHDQRFKTLLKEFLPDFFALFFPKWYARFDFSRVEWLENEVFPDPPEGDRRSMDLVATLPALDSATDFDAEADEWISLIHIEIESADSVTAIRRRMCWYYFHLRQRHNLPVLPLALYLNVGLDGLGTDEYSEQSGPLDVLQFRFLYVGLPRLNAIEYLHPGNRLSPALVALMHSPAERRAWLKAEAANLIRLSETNELQKFLLLECLDVYLALEEAQQAEFEQLLQTEEFAGTGTMIQSRFDIAREEGLDEGLQKGEVIGRRKLVLELFRDRFGNAPPEAQEAINNWPVDRLTELAKRISAASSYNESLFKN